MDAFQVFLTRFLKTINKIINVCGYRQISQNEINHEKLLNQNKNIICRGPDEKQHIEGTIQI